MVARSHRIGKLAQARDMGPQKLSRLSNTGARIVDVDTSWQWCGVELPVDGLDQLGNVVPVFAGHQLRSQQTDQIE
jgi:hypothetical protein